MVVRGSDYFQPNRSDNDLLLGGVDKNFARRDRYFPKRIWDPMPSVTSWPRLSITWRRLTEFSSCPSSEYRSRNVVSKSKTCFLRRNFSLRSSNLEPCALDQRMHLVKLFWSCDPHSVWSKSARPPSSRRALFPLVSRRGNVVECNITMQNALALMSKRADSGMYMKWACVTELDVLSFEKTLLWQLNDLNF